MSQPAFDFDLDNEFDDGGNPTYTVSELADAINAALRSRFYDGVWVRGEIQGWSVRNNHAYFTLVEHDGEAKASLSVALFANAQARLLPLLRRHRLRLGDGMKVRIHGHLDVYAPSGRLSLKMSGIDPRYTLGEMAMQRQDLIRSLVAAGLYDANRSRTLSPAPLRVGVVTSVGSAAWHDFVDELHRSGVGFHVTAVDVRVQGPAAARMVSEALRSLSRLALDVIVVIRGGGSRTDLAVFDTEAIALAIVSSPVPVLTGLGHEIDRSVADEVAHRSLKTPTACAGALVERVLEFQSRSELAWSAISALGSQQLDVAEARLHREAHRIAVRTGAVVEAAEDRLSRHGQRLPLLADRCMGDAVRNLDHLDARVGSLDPTMVMARGWSITRTAAGQLVTDPSQVRPGEMLLTAVAHGSIASEVVDSASEDE